MRNSIALLLLISLSACQNVKHKQVNHNWTDINSWSISGKMAIDDGHQSGSGKFDWKVSTTNLEARFKAPLGQGSWIIMEDNNGARLTSSKHPDRFANNAQLLLSDELGWSFPLEKLKYWLRGYQHLQKQEKHEQAIDSLDDAEWHISYQKWQHTAMGLLPTKIKASKPPYTVKLIIYHWNFD